MCIRDRCRRFAFDLIMCNCEAKTAAATIRELMQNPPDGVIVIGTEPVSYTHLDVYKRQAPSRAASIPP